MLLTIANSSQVNVFLDGKFQVSKLCACMHVWYLLVFCAPFQEQIDVCKLFGVNVTIHNINYNYYTKNSFQITQVMVLIVMSLRIANSSDIFYPEYRSGGLNCCALY